MLRSFITTRHLSSIAIIGVLLVGLHVTHSRTSFAQSFRNDVNPLLFGQTAAFSGPSSELGNSTQRGIAAAFERVNRNGGVFGRKLTLISLDDGYNPERAALNTDRLIREGVLGIIGAVGTPVSRAAQPIAKKFGVPYVGPITGVDFLREPNSGVVNIRASYKQETEVIVDLLVEQMGFKRISVFYQDDSFGKNGLAGVQSALKKHALQLVSEGTFIRNTHAVKVGLLEVRRGRPEAVVIIAPYQATSQFIRWARQIQFHPVFAAVSFVNAKALAESLGSDGEGVIVSQVVPYTVEPELEILGEYRNDMRQMVGYEPSWLGVVSFEGYLAGRFVTQVLEATGPNPTRENFMRVVKIQENFNLGGFNLTFGENDNQGSDEVYLTYIDKDQQLQNYE